MERQRRGTERRSGYIEGSAVRQMDAAPKVRPEIEDERELQRRREQRRRKMRAKRNWERAKQMNRGYVIFLTAAVLAVAFAAVYLIHLQADIQTQMNQVASLKSQVESLKATNDASEKKLETQINLDTIRDIAINQLGMGYPTKDQIVYYDVQNSDYMNQYEDIPKK